MNYGEQEQALNKIDNSTKYNFADFTRENYRSLIRLAKEKYVFRSFVDFQKDECYVLWRHDVDFSIHSARKLAQIEAEEGVVTTYFLLLHSPFYNLFEQETTNCVRDMMAMGHSVALHFDAEYYSIADQESLKKRLQQEAKTLEVYFGAKIDVFSFHNPSTNTQQFTEWQYGGLVNTYAQFFQKEVAYCSDSNGYWRFRRLEDVLREGQNSRLQVLTHPVWWQDTIMSPRQRIHRCVDERARKNKAFYEQLLREFGRENVDWK